MKHLSLLILSLVALGIFIGCRHKESPGSPGASSRPASHEASQAASPGAPQVAETASARIDSAGGSVRLSDGTRAEFPPGALDKPGEVTLRRLKSSPRGQVESACVWLDCTAPAAQFAKDVAIRVPLPVKATAK
jgi:hypothetical protein